MNKLLIKQYIDKINTKDILNFAFNNGIEINSSDAEVLNYHLKNDWMELLYGDPSAIIKNIELKLGSEKALAISNIYFAYKEKYKDYL